MAAERFWFPGVNRFFLLGLLLVATAHARAESAAQEVSDFLASLNRFASTFEQSVQGAHGELIEYTTGQFLLERPRFRWQVEEPYPQIIVSDGDRLSIYDPDLEQVTVRSVGDALAGTPLGLLAREDVDLLGEFHAEERADDPSARHFVLTSLDAQAPYRRIDLWIDGQQLLRIEVLDHYDQRLRVVFTADPLRPVGERPFELDLPEGVGVVEG